ncbi:MAG: histidine phosphatase family protein [Clostridiaceae bacterium]|jgi:broad specificity phosphatase PhoE|nr:histidine phosphatase family protein [Oscillospiraceae bacterium]NLO61964.1 histidine phosphatase family protein [Clostridiaceae bacterium]
MRITIIRHARVDFVFPGSFGPQGQIEASRGYNESPIDPSGIKRVETDDAIFISALRRSRETAHAMFGERAMIRSELFNEVPLGPFTRVNVRLPALVWDVFGRIAWFFRNGSQPERRMQTRERADRAIDLIEEVGRDCYVITHAFFMRTLFRQLRKRGYTTASRMGMIKNLEGFIFEKP